MDYLDQYAGTAKQQALFESVGYGLEDSGPKFSFGGDTRRKADRQLISFKGAYGYRDIAVKFSHAEGGPRRHLLRRLGRPDVRHLDPRDR